MSQSLQSGLIHLASKHPEFRKELLPLLKSAGQKFWVDSDPNTINRVLSAFDGEILGMQGGSDHTVAQIEAPNKQAVYKALGETENSAYWVTVGSGTYPHSSQLKSAGQHMAQSLRSSIIRLASEHPEFRKDLLPLLKSAEQKTAKEALGPEYATLDADYLTDLMENDGVEFKVGHTVSTDAESAYNQFFKLHMKYVHGDKMSLVHDAKTGQVSLMTLEPLNVWLK